MKVMGVLLEWWFVVWHVRYRPYGMARELSGFSPDMIMICSEEAIVIIPL
jgi:hypothetical protein